MPEEIANPRGLSAAVRHAVGLTRPYGADEGVVAPTPPDTITEQSTPADRLAFLEAKYQGLTEKRRNPDNSVALRFTFGEGDAIGVRGSDTRDAVMQLWARLEGASE